VGRDGDHGHRNIDIVCGRVEEEKAVDRALDQHARILLDELMLPIVAGGEIEVVRAG